MTGFPLEDPTSLEAAAERVAAFEAAGATRLIAGFRYPNADSFQARAEAFAQIAKRSR